MISRLQFEEWHTAVALIAFIITFTAFVYLVVRAMRMKRDKIKHLSELPLEEEETTNKHEKTKER